MTSTNINLQEKGLEAAARFLAVRGYEILDKFTDEDTKKSYVIARDESGLVFTEVHTRKNADNTMPEENDRKALRRRLEKVAITFLTTFDEVNLGVRLDVIDILVIGEDRALVRHHIGAATMDNGTACEERELREQEDDE